LDSGFKKGELDLVHLVYCDDKEKVLEKILGGESDRNARPLNYNWVLSIREQCISKGVGFEFRQCGTHFIKDDKEYTLNIRNLCSQARKANIDC
jgi:protein gp37